ncbi:MAG TPA: tRNA (adenosine(37)-N6)-threonylcarbamoyltransferase complex dimerization subunit type 1 TsaB [Thermodesulfobacteriota bacterium]|nr:tRNA (adenosine(37)-N6)-threonylcarbamoyltransferase complex dimerization subunit type 1 TsaB [Thermodesulfobacteriota bacterium]
MRVLGIETSTYSGSVAIVDDDRVLGEVFFNNGPLHSERLLPAIEWLLDGIGVDKKGIEGIAVSVGPGSFTALRIGIATAKGLAFSLGVPIVGVSSLEVLASGLPFAPFTICSIIDARKGEVFAAFFVYSSGKLERIGNEMLIPPAVLIEMIREKTVFIGDGAILYMDLLKSALGELALFCPLSFNFPRASNCALLGIQKLREGLQDDLLALVPRYLRGADAEILKER